MSFLKGSKYKSWVSTNLLTQNVLLDFRLDLLNTIIGIPPLRLEVRSMAESNTVLYHRLEVIDTFRSLH